jgi:hypothetical protein
MSTSPWPARAALLISILTVGAVFGAFNAFGVSSAQIPVVQQTTASPSPSPSESEEECEFEPAPPPICPEEEESPSASPTPTSTDEPEPTPEKRHSSSISIRYDDGTFFGRVRSAAKCERERKVVLRKVRKGPNPIVGRKTTDRTGRWAIDRENARGRFYATVLRRVYTEGGTRHICRTAISKTIRVG